jgi:hypothetical protein
MLSACARESTETTASVNNEVLDGAVHEVDAGAPLDASVSLESDGDAAAPLLGDVACDAGASEARELVLECFLRDQLPGYEAGTAASASEPWSCPSVDEYLAASPPCGFGEGSCCITPRCGPDVRQPPPELSTPDAAAKNQQCCYLVREVCGV